MQYRIRTARRSDCSKLPSIERAAATLFRKSQYQALAEGELASTRVDLTRDFVWVVVDSDDEPVGFAIVQVHEFTVHLHEIDVDPKHARQGLGRRLIETVVEWARDRGASSVTLRTFRDVPWNGPYYERLGFKVVAPEAISPALQRIEKEEREAGLPMQSRVWMQLDI